MQQENHMAKTEQAIGSSGTLDRTVVDHVARLARLAPDEAEQQMLQLELGAILAHFQRISGLDTRAISPAYHPHELENQTRPDTVAPSTERDALLKPAKRQKEGYLQVPRTVE